MKTSKTDMRASSEINIGTNGKGEKITLVRGVVAKPATAGNEVNEDAEGYRATEGTTRAKRGERPNV